MNHSVAAAAAVAPTSISTSIPKPVSTATPTGFNGSRTRSASGWPDLTSPAQRRDQLASGDSIQTFVNSAGMEMYDDEDDDEDLSPST